MLSIFFVSAIAVAQDTSISLTVDSNQVSIGESVSVQISVGGKVFISRPELLGVENFHVQSSGTSSQVQIINGRMASSKVFHYTLIPKKTGTFVIGPAVAESGGTEYKSNTVTVIVGGEAASGPSEEKLAQMTAQVSNKTPYVGEQIVYSAKFLSRVPIQNAQLQIPEFSGFWKEELGDVRNSQKIINGELWQASDIQFALFPLDSGELTIEPVSLNADIVIAQRPSSLFSNPFFGSFYDTERKLFRSSSVSVNVKPLPLEGRPADFSGLVGSFNLEGSISETELEVGDSTTLTIKIHGDGDLKKLEAPVLQDVSNLKIYDDEPKMEVTPSPNGLKESKIFKKAIVPLKPGTLTLPAVSFSYFDTKKGQYLTLSTSPIELHVKPSSKPEQVVVSSDQGKGILKQELEVLGEDLMPIVKDVKALEADILSNKTRFFYLFASVLPFMAFILTIILFLRRKKASTDAGYFKRGRAYRKAMKHSKKLKSYSGAEFHQNISLILRDYIGDRLTIDGRALTATDIQRKLEPAGANAATCEKASALLGECDAGLYGGKEFGEEERNKMTQALKEILTTLEKELKK